VPEPLFDLSGKIALVTGASGDMGRAIAITLAEHGADIAAMGRTEGALAETAKRIQAAGRRVASIPADLLDATSYQSIVDRCVEAFGGVDILVNCAGGGAWSTYGWAMRLNQQQWDDMLTINLKAPMFIAQAAAKVMKDRGGGRIINISSGAGSHASPRMSNYGAAKAGLDNLSQTLAAEWAQFGIRVNVVIPGLVDTANARGSTFDTPERYEQFTKMMPLGRIGLPTDIASAVLYFASPAAEWVTGTSLLVHGGGANLRSFG
jgi:NAD(P)-dependent dehydrogenase (short-subunit alcohol dehydrogenase family)